MMTSDRATIDPAVLVQKARQAQREWAETSVRRRLVPVEVFRKLLVSECDALCAVVSQEVGKPPIEALAGEVLPTADACRFLVRQAQRLLKPRRVSWRQRPLWLWGQSDTVYRRPRGVVGIIGTWNYPLFLNAGQILHAVTAGNAVVWKPSEVTPRFAELLCRLLRQAGFPAELIQLLPATREMGAGLVESAIDHVVFTGSAAVGKKLAGRLGERLISSTMELSGCDPQVVLEDSDVVLAARAAWFGCTINRGQTCIAVRRCLVHRSLYPGFCTALRTLAAGTGTMPLVLPAQVQQAEQLLADALAQGGQLLVPGRTSADGGCRPTVVIDARPEMALCREAAFAPVMAVMPFDTIEEAVKLEAACPYALGASVFTRNTALAEKVAARMRAGTVAVNDVVVPTAHPATPFGGRGESGWGVTQGAEGLLEMTVPQTVSVRGGTFRPHHDPNLPEGVLRGMLEATHAATIGQRLRGWWLLLRAALGRTRTAAESVPQRCETKDGAIGSNR
jgi:acyl-CoA reductase-like NAD-dependent aldehyde dehydrogenase